MAKTKTLYTCSECGYKTPKWFGKCPSCNSWDSLEEAIDMPVSVLKAASTSQTTKIKKLSEIEYTDLDRYKTKISEFDRLLGGGLIEGEVVLITGNPGIGKSTLLLQVINEYTSYGNTLYISGEESSEQIKNRADRLKIKNDDIFIMTEVDILKIYDYIITKKPKVVVVDSIQTLYNPNLESLSGTPTQIKECTLKIIEIAKNHNISFFVIGHITKDGKIAGPKLLEHMVDAVFNFEGEEGLFYRILRSTKNRFGSSNEIAVFNMEEEGMKEVKNSSEYFLSEREEKI